MISIQYVCVEHWKGTLVDFPFKYEAPSQIQVLTERFIRYDRYSILPVDFSYSKVLRCKNRAAESFFYGLTSVRVTLPCLSHKQQIFTANDV